MGGSEVGGKDGDGVGSGVGGGGRSCAVSVGNDQKCRVGSLEVWLRLMEMR